ncbi:MAG: CoA transferase [Bacteroidia bacterium]
MLENLTVIELASVLAGPATGMFFAEMGATVIKVENPAGGDITRSWRLARENSPSDISAYFSAVNWGKKSISLDLKTPFGQKVVHTLAGRADIIISSFLPGSAQRLNLDADTLLQINPRLICAEINGYGETESRPAYDAIIQAESGFTYLNGTPGNISKMPVALMDILAAHQLKEAILLALIRRFATGKGGKVSVSLMEAGISSLANQATNWLCAGVLPQPIGSEHPNIAPYGTIFTTHDGMQVVLAVGTDIQFENLCRVLGLELPEEMRTNSDRVKQREVLNEFLRKAIAGRDRATFLAELREANVPAGAVHDLEEVFKLPLAAELTLNEGQAAGLRTFAAHGLGRKNLTPPPRLGQDTVEILGQAGYLPEEGS